MPMRVLLLALALLLSLPAQAATRSNAVKAAFARKQACPATALNTLPCPGFIIDDKIALDCGGRDVVENKQWLTVKAAKDKDQWERSYPGCQHPTKTPPPKGVVR